MVEQQLVLRLALFRIAEAHQFHLVELVDPYQPPRIGPVGAGLPAEAGAVGRIGDRQVLFPQDALPDELKDVNPLDIMRRLDGELTRKPV